jgi:hypothetical protein
MNAPLQTILALVVVAIAAIWLVARVVVKRKAPGCGGDCGCASTGLKAKIKR